jgi:Xaa-Pro aminopeptidase
MASVKPGRPELAAWAEVRAAMELVEKPRLTVIADFLTGVDRTAAFTGPPNERVVQPGDPVMVDLGPRAASGYWGDSCNTFVLGEPAPKLVALHKAVVGRAGRMCDVLRPGIRANELDRAVRAGRPQERLRTPPPHRPRHRRRHPRIPRIVEREAAVLEPNMVLMIEPGAYAPGLGGVRHEWMFRVTETGNEVLSTHEHTLTPVG